MIGRLNRWMAHRRRSRSAKAVVLMYHRVANVNPDPWELCVSPENFEAQAQALARDYRVATLSGLLLELRSGALRQRTVAITFDDGYADNLQVAAATLARHGLPATFFITSGAVGSTSEFWWDRLERCLLAPRPLPPVLRLDVAGADEAWNLGGAANDVIDSRDAARPWEAEPSSRLGFFYSVWRYLRDLEDEPRDSALCRIEAWSGTDPGPRPTHRILSRKELRELAEVPGMTIGAHSVSHAALSICEPEKQELEMRGSKAELERLLQRPVTLFAYPFGDFGAETQDLVRQTGFEGACTADPDVVWSGTDPYGVPRLAAVDQNSIAFCRELDAALQ